MDAVLVVKWANGEVVKRALHSEEHLQAILGDVGERLLKGEEGKVVLEVKKGEEG